MKRMKRLVALLVAIATMASLCVFSIPVFAEDAATAPAVTVSDEDLLRIEKLEALGVIDVKYDPADYVTRREMSDIIIKYMNITPSANTDGTPFRDVTMKDSSFASICTLYNLGIVSGDEQLRFNPDNNVTYDEALVFVINALGYKMFAAREGGYPTGYHRVAIKLNMLKGLAMQKGTDPVTFPDLYKILESALDAAAVVPEYYGDGSVVYSLSDTDTYLYEKFNIRKYRGIVTGNEHTRLTSAKSDLTDEQIEIDGRMYETPGYVYGYFLGYAVDYFVKVNSTTDAQLIYIEEAARCNETFKIDAEDILAAETTADRIYYENEDYDKEHISFEENIDVIYNNQCWTGYGELKNAVPARGYIEALDNDNDGTYEVLFVYEYENYFVEGMDTYNMTVTDACTGKKVTLDTAEYEVLIHFTGETKKRNFNSIAIGSLISVLESKGTTDKVFTVYINTETVIGQITGKDSSGGYVIGENRYEKAYNYDSFKDEDLDGVCDEGERVFPELALKLEGVFYLDMNGDIAAYKVDKSATNGEIGLISAIQVSDSVLSPEVAVKIFTREGTFIYPVLAEKFKFDGAPYDLSDSSNITTVVKKLTKNNPENKVDSVYIVTYKLDGSGKVTEIATKDLGGPGNINVITENQTGRFLVRGQMVVLDYQGSDYNDDIFTRYNNETSVTFMAPVDEKIDDETLYSISTYKFSGDRHVGPGQTTLTCDSYSAYSLGLTDIPVVDAFLMKVGSGSTAKPTADNTMAIVTEVTTSIDEDGQVLPKIYFNEGETLALAKEVTIWDSTRTEVEITDSNTLIQGVTPEIKEGTILVYATNFEGNIDRIMFVANYDSTNGLVTRSNFTRYDGHALGFIGEDSSSGVTSNICFGEIVKNDTQSKLLQVKLGSNENIVFSSAGSIYIYVSERNQLVPGKAADLTPQDEFIAKLKKYFELDMMIIFR